MARYKLSLTDGDGLLLRQWVLSNPAADEGDTDFFTPLLRVGPAVLAREINEQIEAAELS